jgi:hypothetical protein
MGPQKGKAMDNDIRPQQDGSDSFLYAGEEQHYASGALGTQPSYPGEEHYYGSEKIRIQRSFDRRDVWKVSTAVLAGMVALLLVNTMRMAQQATHQRLAHPQRHTTSFAASGPMSIFTAHSVWQGTFYQHDNYGAYRTHMILRIDSAHGSRFSGTTTETDFENAVTTVQGTIVDHTDSLGYTDKERFQALINKYGSTGTLIMFTNPDQLNGNNIMLHSHAYALVTRDGILHGIDFDPDHNPVNLRSDGDFTLYLS